MGYYLTQTAMLKNIIFIAALIVLVASCKTEVSPKSLYGRWRYVKVEHPNANPPDSVSSRELSYAAPFIQFSKNDSLLMVWDGSVLSKGKFRTDGNNIRYTEDLPDGKKREFPFWVIKLTDKEIIFETTGEEKSRVTAWRSSLVH
jgi:hypothetical protein